MRVPVALAILGIGLLSAGCSVVEQGTRVLVAHVTQTVDEFAERQRNGKWAEAAWQDTRTAAWAEGRDYSDEYGRGFREGFAEFLYAGGSGEPPVLPPSRYRRLCYQTPAGFRAIEDWFAGYRHGAAVARDGGFRQWVTGPSALLSGGPPLLPPPAPPPQEEIPVPRITIKVLPPRGEGP